MEKEHIAVCIYCLAYNHEKYIQKTLEGFVKQKTSFRYHAIVHDDASTDSTPEIIRQYAEKYPDIIIPIFQKENQYSKITKDFNGIRDAIVPFLIGDYVAICEGDDYWSDENKLQKQYDALEENPSCSVCTHLVQCCEENGAMMNSSYPTDPDMFPKGIISQEQLATIFWGNRINYQFHTSSYFLRKKCYNDMLALNLKRDVGILLACFLNGSMYYFDEPMSVRRMFSRNNYNSRKIKSNIGVRIDDRRMVVEQNTLINKLTDGKYDKFIQKYLFSSIMAWAPYNTKLAKEDIANYSINYKQIRPMLNLKLKIRYDLLYFSLMYFPLLMVIPRWFLDYSHRKKLKMLKKIENAE